MLKVSCFTALVVYFVFKIVVTGHSYTVTVSGLCPRYPIHLKMVGRFVWFRLVYHLSLYTCCRKKNECVDWYQVGINIPVDFWIRRVPQLIQFVANYHYRGGSVIPTQAGWAKLQGWHCPFSHTQCQLQGPSDQQCGNQLVNVKRQPPGLFKQIEQQSL